MGKEVTEVSMDEESGCVITHSPNGKICQTSPCRPSTVVGSYEPTDSQDDANSHEGHVVPRVRNLTLDQGMTEKYKDQKSLDQKSATSNSANATVLSDHTVCQTFSAANKKHGCGVNCAFVSEAAANGHKHPNGDIQSANSQMKAQVCFLLFSMPDLSLAPAIPCFSIVPFESNIQHIYDLDDLYAFGTYRRFFFFPL